MGGWIDDGYVMIVVGGRIGSRHFLHILPLNVCLCFVTWLGEQEKQSMTPSTAIVA